MEVHQILEASQSNNAKDNITGALFFDEKYFFQVMEGPRVALSRRFAAILRDQRHTDVILTLFEELQYRMFPDWRMATISDQSNAVREIYASYLGGEKTPDKMSGASIWQMIEEMSLAVLTRKVDRI